MPSQSKDAVVRTRRGFLAAAAVGGAGLAGLARDADAQRAERIPLRQADPGLKVVRAEAYALAQAGEFAYGGVRKPDRQGCGYFEVETANGLIGHGITAIVDAVAVRNLANQAVAPLVVGENAMNNEAVWSKLFWALTPRGQTGIATHAISGFDIALWDLKGKACNAPIASLFGGARTQVPMYVTFGPAFLDRDELVAVAKDMVGRGFRDLKMVVGQGATARRDTRPLDRVITDDTARVRAVREAVGPDVNLYLDGNCNFDYPSAERLVRELAPTGSRSSKSRCCKTTFGSWRSCAGARASRSRPGKTRGWPTASATC